MSLDDLDRTLTNRLQKDFPLVARPFAELAARTGTSEDELIERVSKLKSSGLIRVIGPVVDARSLGYGSTLVAMKVTRTKIGQAEQAIAGHAGISHAYERTHDFNVWLTVAVAPGADIGREVDCLKQSTGASEAMSLPATRVFKIGVFFDMTGEGADPAGPNPPAGRGTLSLSHLERTVLNVLQQDLPLAGEPFAAMAMEAGVSPDQFLAAVRSLRERGVIRRFGAAVNHHRAGFTSNVMSCWAVPPERVDEPAAAMVAAPDVSHCYERLTNVSWRYNLFAMIHGRHREDCEAVVARIAAATGLDDYALLYTVREIKKTRVKYLA